MDMKIKLDALYVPSPDVVARKIEGELILIPITSGIGDLEDELFTLNATGRDIWDKMDGKRSLRAIAAELAAEYSAVPGEIEEDVCGLMKELLKRRIVVEGGGR